MSKYTEIIYPKDDQNEYPMKLSTHLYKRFMAPRFNFESSCKILDIGCCTGKALRLFGELNNFDLYGVDIRDENIDDITFKTCNIEHERLPFPDNYFDVVYSKSVLEHVRNTDNFISESLRVLKPAGLFLGLTPDWNSQHEIFWDDYTHVKPFTRKGLRDALRIHNFKGAECEYFYQLPFLWEYPSLTFLAKLVALLPESWKWKDEEQRNTKDRKLIRFSKEKMLLSFGVKRNE